MANRIAMLEEFVKDDPTDPFNFYALALEYQKTDSHKAIDIFNRLMQEHPAYLPTYYQLAKLYQSLEDKQRALDAYDKGIVVATAGREMKTLQELKSARQELVFDDEV